MKRVITFTNAVATIDGNRHVKFEFSGQEKIKEELVEDYKADEILKSQHQKLRAEDQARADMVRWQNEAKAKELEDMVNRLVDKKVKEIEFEKNKREQIG